MKKVTMIKMSIRVIFFSSWEITDWILESAAK